MSDTGACALVCTHALPTIPNKLNPSHNAHPPVRRCPHAARCSLCPRLCPCLHPTSTQTPCTPRSSLLGVAAPLPMSGVPPASPSIVTAPHPLHAPPEAALHQRLTLHSKQAQPLARHTPPRLVLPLLCRSVLCPKPHPQFNEYQPLACHAPPRLVLLLLCRWGLHTGVHRILASTGATGWVVRPPEATAAAAATGQQNSQPQVLGSEALCFVVSQPSAASGQGRGLEPRTTCRCKPLEEP